MSKFQEAIDVFEMPSKHIKCVHKCKNGMEFLTYSQDLVAAFETAIYAIKKQIPKKCVKDDCNRDCCPVCGWIIGYGDTIQPHCHNCGQALDWSENEQ